MNRLARFAEACAVLLILIAIYLAAKLIARRHKPARKAGRRPKDYPMDQAPSVIPAYVASLLRQGLTSAGGFLIANGYLSGENATALGGAITVIASIAWGLYQKHNASKDLKAAIAAPAGMAS